MQLVDPANLAETFGLGISLKFITIATIREPITKGKILETGIFFFGRRIERSNKKFNNQLLAYQLFRKDFIYGN